MTESIKGDLYPDIVAMGGLISAMEGVARKKGIDLGRVYSQYTSGPGLFVTAEVDSSRGRISVSLGDWSRAFHLGIQENRFIWADGVTEDLEEVVMACTAWRDGTPVENFAEKFHFMTPGRLARARETGESTPAQWKWLRTSEMFAEERPLVEAFRADGRFNDLFPNLSHGTLRLSTNYGIEGSQEIHVIPTPGGTYRVEDTAAPGPGRLAASLEEALAAAAESLSGD
ncbi:DUF6193 family natural product biosynthesis protein [Streptomyces sp. ISL-94]|uniref:DUF6193 family natural product biosynthesis protein n=1 Tax=Streptomyces sp. ISL-94 TaxID=2819190 RepID=UPI001BE83A66|nr:DUF6193 family natural product biosynthesis protein [Streptomyces sp. ISL-94]MBT2480361.1 hypothetical protein [Streptomyces sp. ISL-94]